MPHLLRLTDEERSDYLRRAIRRKCHYNISEDRLEHLLSKLNIRKPYVLKTTDQPEKFLNIITAERIATEKHRVISEIIPIYGTFIPGYFERLSSATTHSGTGYIDARYNAAAVKISLFQSGTDSAFATYTLVLYESSYSKTGSILMRSRENPGKF